MPIQAPTNPVTGKPVKERIMLYGEEGEGKSFAVFTVADVLQRFGSPAAVHIIDTDGGSERTYCKMFQHLKNVRCYEAFTWQELKEAEAKVLAAIQPDKGDWIVVDLWCRAWDFVQEYYSENIFSKGIEEHFMVHRAKMLETAAKGGHAFDGMRDWPTIKKLFNTLASKLILNSRCNVILCCKAKIVDAKRDGEDIIGKYGRIGFRPAGNGDSNYLVHSIFNMSTKKVMMAVPPREAYWMRSSKYRGTEGSMKVDCEVSPLSYVDQAGATQYAGGWGWQYLVGMEGWQVWQ